MSTNEVEQPDPEDMFSDTRMSFGDHIDDLRTHLLRTLKGFVIGMIISVWPLGQYVLHIIVSPVESQLKVFQDRKLTRDNKLANDRIENAQLTLPAIRTSIRIHKLDLKAALAGEDAEPQLLDVTLAGYGQLVADLKATDLLSEENRLAVGELHRQRTNYIRLPAEIDDPRGFTEQMQRTALNVSQPSLKTMHISEAFFVYFKVAMMTGLVIASPWVFWQVWMFVAAGLYPTEKRIVHVYLPFSLFLFLAGVFICQFAVMPRAIEAMLWFNEWLGLEPDLRLNEWLGFALMMPIVFGVSFQTPLVMMFMHKVGIVRVQTYRDKRRISWFVMAIFSAIITPSVDAVSMLFLWLPMGALYELGILLCVYQGEEEEESDDESAEEKSSELVEV